MKRERDFSYSDYDSDGPAEPKKQKMTYKRNNPDTTMSIGQCVEGTSYTPQERQSELLQRMHYERIRTGKLETKYDYDLKLVQGDIRTGRNRQSYTICPNNAHTYIPTRLSDIDESAKICAKNEIIQTINNDYKIKKLMGEGEFGDSYRVINNTGNSVSLKLFRVQIPNHDDKEMEIFQKIKGSPHENLVELLSTEFMKERQRGFTGVVITTSGTLFSIRSVLKRARKAERVKTSVFIPASIKSIGKQIVSGMIHLEKLKVYHLNISSSNIFFAEDNRFSLGEIDNNFLSIEMINDHIKIGDFEYSRFHPKPGVVVHQENALPYAYGPPETLFGAPHGIKTDVWAVTTVFAEMYKHKHPFLARTRNKSEHQNRCEAIFHVLDVNFMDHVFVWNDQYMDLGRRLVNPEYFFNENEWVRAPQKINEKWIRVEEDREFLNFLISSFIVRPELRPSFKRMSEHEFLSEL